MLRGLVLVKTKDMVSKLGSIKSRFALLILLVSIPSVALMYYQASSERERNIEHIFELSREISSQISQSQINIINDSREFLQNLSQEPFLQQPASTACNLKLASLLRLTQSYINIGAPLANGDLLCNALPLNKKVNVSDREYIQKALNEKVFSISPFQVDRAAGKVSVNFAYPVFKTDSDSVIALIVVVLSLDWWSEQLSLYDLPEGSTAVITDSDDKIIANFPQNNQKLGTIFNYHDKTALKENTTIETIDKVKHVQSQTILYKKSNDNFVKFSISIPIDTLIKDANQHFYQSLTIYLLLVSITSAFAMRSLNKNIVKPITRLAHATNNLEAGKATILLEYIGANEIKLLSKHFSKMSKTRLLAEKESLSRSKELSSVFTALPDTYIRVNNEGKILDYKDNHHDGSNNNLSGKYINDLFDEEIVKLFINNITTYGTHSSSKVWEYIDTINNKENIYEARITKVHNSAEFVIIIRNITERKRSEEKVWRNANFDDLTQLPNRKYFYEKLEQALSNAKIQENRLAVLFIDLDQFKEVNDTLGHHVGDKLLQTIAQRLSGCVRKTDLVARLGGDEFTIIIDNLPNTQMLEKITKKILHQVHKAINIDGKVCYTSPSIGISLFPDNCDTVNELIKTADQAMFAAKKMGRNRFNYYKSEMQEQAMKRMHLINDLRIAIKKQQFHLVYQPIVDLKTQCITKVEALIRWNHPEKGFIPPDEFIPLAEETELIFPIGYWIIQEVAQKMDELMEHFGESFEMSINISPMQFMNQDPIKNHWFEAINTLPEKYKLILEITEGLLMDASDATKEKFQTFVDKGISLSIDDFGTGYSSLAYINEYDIDFLKIDRSFVMNMSEGSSNLVLCEAIIVMAHKLGIKVIAEGVETFEQLDLLENMQCDFAQGYYYSKPCVFEELLCLQKQFNSEPALIANNNQNSLN